jgi:hypothetical protein
VNFYGTFYQIYRSSRSNTISQSGLFILIRAVTSYILEVSRGKVPEIVLGRICNPFAKSLCAYTLSAFRPRGSLDRRVNCRCVPQPRWVSARRNTKGGGKPQLMLSCARVGALAVGVTSVREGERESRATTLSYEGPGSSFYRCKERVQVYNGGVAIR